MREKKKSPVTDIRNFFHGVVADRCMRRWLDSDNPVAGEMVSWVDEMVELCLEESRSRGDGVVRWRDLGDRARVTEWVRVLLERLEPFLLQNVIPYEYQPEFRFRVTIRIPDLNGELTEVDLVGGMDILVRESSGPPAVWAGYDLKATENPDYLRKTLGQGIFYSLAQLALTGEKFRTFAFLQPMVEDNPVAHVKITDDDLQSMLARVVKMSHDIWRGDIAPKSDSEGCSMCFVKHACEKFRSTSKTVFAPKRKPAA